ncbi:MAG: hypothetical protein V1897_03320 [Pseudomonadota bacterium]
METQVAYVIEPKTQVMNHERDWTEVAKQLKYEVKNYQALTKMIVQIMNRSHAYDIPPETSFLLHGEKDKTGKLKIQGLEQLKSKQARAMEKLIESFPIWTDWLTKIPGIGPAIGSQLICLYYFKFVPVCAKCGADISTDAEDEDGKWACPSCGSKAKGEGILKHRVELRDFPHISSWWHFLGRHNDPVTGKMPKRKAGVQGDWSNLGRKLGYDVKESFNKQPSSHLYKAYAEKRKRYRLNTHPDATPGYRHNMAWNETVKLFLSHFWQVSHTLNGEEMTQPWSVTHGGHDERSIIAPYYF